MSSITKQMLLKGDPALKNRPYQLDALMCIFQYVRCLVKMFCGTGKSRIITNVIIHAKKELSVIVFPSLALINQYSADYLKNAEYATHFKGHKMLNVSSEKLENVQSTTDRKEIEKFFKLKSKKIILVTYQSYQVLLSCLNDNDKKIGLVCYDEAHHIVSPETQKSVFTNPSPFEKEVFFTATPRNENGITMFDREDPENNMCGPVAYDYTYMQGLRDEVLNQFEICVDMYTENTNSSIYEAMARCILSKGTNRGLTFHSGVNGESNTDVRNFVQEKDSFQRAFDKVVASEFPEKAGYYTKLTLEGMDGTTPADVRKLLLATLDNTPDNEIYIISSCETIGEGVDTKKANMCVFADPKASVIKIIQNIGRVVRRNPLHPLSAILIPCWVNMENYASAGGDRAKQDEIIREQMRSEKGDYAGILNVLCALRQEDPEIYEVCLNYPNRRAKVKSLKEQGFVISGEESDSDSINSEESDGDESDSDEESDDCDSDSISGDGISDYDEESGFSSDEVQQMKEELRPLEIHTNDTITRYNMDGVDIDSDYKDGESEMLRLYYDEDDNTYKEIKPINPLMKKDRKTINPPPKNSGVKMSMHKNDDIEMLWGVKGELDFSKKFCTAVIDCEVSFGVEKWRADAKKVCECMDKNGKRPSQSDKDKEIKRLGSWISNQNTNYKKNAYIMKNLVIRAEWEAILIKYNEYLIIDREEDWRDKCKKLCDYMDKEKKRPSKHDKNTDIKKLGLWISNQNTNYNKNIKIMKNLDIRGEWETVLEKYNEYLIIDREEDWRDDAKKSCDYMDKNGRRPSDSDKDKDIKKLARWIVTQKKNYEKNANIMQNPVIRVEWEAILIKYNEYLIIDREEDWRSICKKVCEYMDNNNKRPSDGDKNTDIKKLGLWISNQNANYNKNINIMKNPVIRKEWEAVVEKYKEYLCVGTELWRSICKKVCEYMDKEKKRPSGKDNDEYIKTLGMWIGTQNRNYKKKTQIMENPEIRKEWETMLIKYSLYLRDGEEDWRSTCNKLCEYIDKEKKRPSNSDKDKDIKSLASWINTQNQNYKKNTHIMKTNPEIRKEWEAMLIKYKEYLKYDIILSPPSPVEMKPEQKLTKAKEIKKVKSTSPSPTQSPSPSPSPTPTPKKVKLKLKVKVKSYADLSEDEKRKMCERVLKLRQEEHGYRSTNPDDKDKINAIFAKSVSLINCDSDGKVVFLDHTDFKTAFALLEMGIKPEDMLIPQRADNYEGMSQHELFGSSVVLGEFNDVLSQHMLGGGKVKGIYADYCSALQTDGLPFLELIRAHRKLLTNNAVIGITITLRNPIGVRFAGQDISNMSIKLLKLFPNSINLFVEGGILKEDDGPYTYGEGASMATWMIKLE